MRHTIDATATATATANVTDTATTTVTTIVTTAHLLLIHSVQIDASQSSGHNRAGRCPAVKPSPARSTVTDISVAYLYALAVILSLAQPFVLAGAHSAAGLQVPAHRCVTVKPIPTISTGTTIRPNAASTIVAGIDTLPPHNRPLRPAAAATNSLVVWVVDAPVPGTFKWDFTPSTSSSCHRRRRPCPALRSTTTKLPLLPLSLPAQKSAASSIAVGEVSAVQQIVPLGLRVLVVGERAVARSAHADYSSAVQKGYCWRDPCWKRHWHYSSAAGEVVRR
eukprot:11422-Heterococcus_DN1.PRE.6